MPARGQFHDEVFRNLFEEPIGKILLDNQRLRLIIFDARQEVIRTWTA